jgi:hypothetical protein
MGMPPPAKVLEIGPGLGRSAVFFAKKLGWQRAEFHLYDGDGSDTKYTLLGPRFDDSFCGNLALLRKCLDFNGLTRYKIFNARGLGARLSGLPGPYDLIYSFYSVGFHWSLEHFLDEILALMHERSVGVFMVFNEFEEFPALRGLAHHIVTSRAVFPAEDVQKLLILRK